MARQNIISIDIGNSRIKLLDDFVFYAYEFSQENWLERISNVLISSKGTNSKFVLSSVNNPVKKLIEVVLRENDLQYIAVEELLQYTKLINFSKVVGMGTDRKLGLIGAISLATAPLIVIDCGTATTINFLDERNYALGGAIFPGLETQAKALNTFTDLLPYVDLYFSGSYCGATTETAIQSGIFASVVGGIKETISKGSKSLFRKVKPTIILTGGGSSQIAHLLDGLAFIVEPNLVLIGIRNLASEYYSLNK